MAEGTRQARVGFWSLVATCGGLGQLPRAPGTWGSLVGLLLGAFLIQRVSQWVVCLGFWVLFILAALVCTQAERELGQHDPSTVILDEVWGMAFVMITVPAAASSWVLGSIALLVFRVFDVTKPPPLRRLARWPAGWGIMADDLGAALYTIAVLWLLRIVL